MEQCILFSFTKYRLTTNRCAEVRICGKIMNNVTDDIFLPPKARNFIKSQILANPSGLFDLYWHKSQNIKISRATQSKLCLIKLISWTEPLCKIMVKGVFDDKGTFNVTPPSPKLKTESLYPHPPRKCLTFTANTILDH